MTALLCAGITYTLAQPVVCITQDEKVFTIANASAPGTTSMPVSITGIATGQTIVGADYRPLTGELYLLGYDGMTNDAQLYTLNTTSGMATAVNSMPVQLMLGNMGNVGFDFNPTVDRIRVIGENKKNYRLHPVTGALVATDGDLAFAGTDVNAAVSAAVGACAYTNSYVGATVTTLYNYEQNLNVLTTQVPPNNGTLNTVGSTGIIVNLTDPSMDMDIYTDPMTLGSMAYLSANTGVSNNDNLYSINLTTGMVTSIGTIGGGMAIKNIAVPINRTLPAITGRMAYGIQTNTNTLLAFDTDNPRFIRGYMGITGIASGQSIVGIDFRPADFMLYALGYNPNNMEYQLYTINTMTAAATAVNTMPGMIDLGNTTNIAFDFNPVADRIRVIGGKNGNNYRLNPANGNIAVTDTAMAYLGTDANAGVMPKIGSCAYTNSYPNTTGTQLFALDDSLGLFVNVTSPNGGTISTVSSLTMTVNPADMSTDIDYFYDSVSQTNIGYMCTNSLTGLNDKLYTINAMGTVMLINDIGFGIPMSDIAVQPQYKNAPTSVASVATKQASFSFWPNPAIAEINIAIAGKPVVDAQVTIYDMTGKKALQTNANNGTVNISSLSKGIYFLQLSTGGEPYAIQKLVIE